MKFIRFHILLLLLALYACRSTQEVAAPVPIEVKVPIWVSSRPNNGFKYVGIGFAEKKPGSNYQMEAKKNALYDLASEIKVDISSNSVLYTVQNNSGFNENFNSLIKLSNSDNIEGYTLVDSYENDKQYWVYYQLDKQEYADLKARKKQQTITKASALIASAYQDEKNQDFSSALKKRIQAFGVLTPYLSEEISFNPAETNGLKTVFDLTSLIQQQLQSISVMKENTTHELIPFQAKYEPLLYHLILKNKMPLQNFPFSVDGDDDRIQVEDKTTTDQNGSLSVKVISLEPLNQFVSFSLAPDINTLMGSDSVGRAGITLLKQFISTPALKVQASIRYLNICIQVEEKNYGKPTGAGVIENLVRQKFDEQEVHLVSKPEQADYLIQVVADTQNDISSDVLERNFDLKLSQLSIELQLLNTKTKEVEFKKVLNEIYGYANSAEKAGINAYSNPKLKGNLAEGMFFLKRRILVY
ncbi:MAG TPA: LPP20 family lipoprotein [Bacteroidia bacterium]|nr:LPP20 family lipoprotein [Bacteroidia bacterium]